MQCVYQLPPIINLLEPNWWLSGKGSACQCRRCRFNPWVRKIPWRRKWQPTPVFLPGKSHGQRSPTGYSPWGCKELDTTWQLNQKLHEKKQNKKPRREISPHTFQNGYHRKERKQQMLARMQRKEYYIFGENLNQRNHYGK